ncbi:translocation/assembly module TamB domain-containing protein, partial [Paraprevotella clara]
NFELINAKRTQQASAYGKVYVDVNARMAGNLNNININGRLGVLGSTDVTYVLKDTPLSSEDRLSGLVTFVDFSDTTTVATQEEVQPMNMNVMMQISIDQGTQVHCLLSADRSKYVDLEGGGELTMNYTPQGELTLTGRYTVLNGEMKYSLPVIPLKTFTIASGSYVDFNGPILNPTLNISASERMRATVTENDTPRTVSFEVGLSITRTLENMGLEFTIAAPEDMTVQNQLAAMSIEERGKVAVTMLATGMYLLGDNESGGFSTTNALNALLQSEITNIAGKALETIDLSLGVDQETTAEGTERTDYSFRFAKRFWGNRVSIIVGGKVSTGENVENTGQSLIDNVSLEYRLDKSATRYVTLFYDKSYESLLEGEITEMGAGLVLRRKMTRLGELFIFKNRKKNEPQHEKEKK